MPRTPIHHQGLRSLDTVRLPGSSERFDVLDNDDWPDYSPTECHGCHFFDVGPGDCNAPRLTFRQLIPCWHYANVHGVCDVIFRKCDAASQAARGGTGRKWPKFLPD